MLVVCVPSAAEVSSLQEPGKLSYHVLEAQLARHLPQGVLAFPADRWGERDIVLLEPRPPLGPWKVTTVADKQGQVRPFKQTAS